MQYVNLNKLFLKGETMENISLSNRFYEKNVLKGCKEIFEKMNEKTSKSGHYKICEDSLILPEILAVLLKSGHDLDIFLFDCGACPTACHVQIFSKNDNEEGQIKKISFNGPPNHRMKDAKDYERKILEAKNSIECDSVLRELNNIYL